MSLETGTYIDSLVVTNPTASDPKSEGDDHLRLLKSTVKATFPNVTGAVTATHTELNFVDGVTSAIQTQIDTKAPIADPTFTGEIGIGGVNVSETELGILEGATVTTSELNILDGVTSTTVELNILDGVTATTAELNFSDGVTSNIQAQLDSLTGAAYPITNLGVLSGAEVINIGSNAETYFTATLTTAAPTSIAFSNVPTGAFSVCIDFVSTDVTDTLTITDALPTVDVAPGITRAIVTRLSGSVASDYWLQSAVIE